MTWSLTDFQKQAHEANKLAKPPTKADLIFARLNRLKFRARVRYPQGSARIHSFVTMGARNYSALTNGQLVHRERRHEIGGAA